MIQTLTKNIFLAMAVICAMSFPAYGVNTIGTCHELVQKFELCEPYSCEHAHPDTRREGVMVRMEIVGKTDDGKCLFKQSTKSGDYLECRYSEKSIGASNRMLDQYFKAGIIQITDSDQHILNDAFDNECG